MSDKCTDLFTPPTDEDLSWKAIQELDRKRMEQRERDLAKAFFDGYDGADVVMNRQFQERVVPWNGGPPSYGRFSAPKARYDFRGLTFADLRRGNDK